MSTVPLKSAELLSLAPRLNLILDVQIAKLSPLA